MSRYVLDEIQQRDYARLKEAAASRYRRIIYQAPTGAGKTVTACHLIESATAKGKRVLFIAPRRELIHQCGEKLRENGVSYGVEMAEHGKGNPEANVVLASKDTLYARYKRFGKHFLPPADLIIYDEAHLTAPTVETLFNQYPDAHIIGLTATPARPNGGKGLGDLYDHLLIGPTYAELIERGRLVRSRLFRPSAPDMTGVASSAGDYNQRERQDRADKPELVGDIVQHWLKWASDRKTIVFTTGVRHSMHIAESFRASGVSAQHIDGDFTVEDREQLMREFRSGDVQVLTNCQIATYGLDIPDIGCIVFACPTKSIVKWKQCAGRGLRAAPGKTDLIVMDHADASRNHGMPDEDIPWDLEKKVGEKAKKKVTEKEKKNIVCPKCKAVYQSKPVCPECGEPAPKRKPQDVETAPGELKEVTQAKRARNDTLADKQKFWRDQCLGPVIGRNQKMGVAAAIFKDHYGVPPWKTKVKPVPDGRAGHWKMRGRDWWNETVKPDRQREEGELFKGLYE